MLEILILSCTGFTVGILGTLLGIGGGSLIVPILSLFLGYSIHSAVAIGLITIIATSAGATSSYLISGLTNISLGYYLSLFSVTSALIGGIISNRINEKPLFILFALVLFITAAIYLFGRQENEESEDGNEKNGFNSIFRGQYYDSRTGSIVHYVPKNLYITSLISSVAGLMSGMLGIGGGVFQVPAMNVISKIPMKAATATSNFIIGLTAISGGIVYLKEGNVSPLPTCVMVIAVFYGSKFALYRFSKITDRKLKILFVFFLLFIGVQMFIKGIKP